MKIYSYKTDAVSGEVEATSLQAALEEVIEDEQINEDMLADGAWAWVEDPDTEERQSIGQR